MTVRIDMSPEAEADLRKKAAAAGLDLNTFVLQALEEKLAALDEAEDNLNLPADQWIARLRRWAAGHRPLPYEADDSREGIYAGRGE